MNQINNIDIKPEQFFILSILTHSKNVLKLKSRLKLFIYLSDNELEENVYSYTKGNVGPEPERLDEHLAYLEDKDIITIEESFTFGGDKRYRYYINKEFSDDTSQLLNETDERKKVHNTVKDVHSKYKDIPISNLIKQVRDNHYEYFRNNSHVF